MLDRIKRKLFLSVKIMGSDNPSSSQSNNMLRSNELMDILRKGSSALANSDGGMDLEQFLRADVSAILDASRLRETSRDTKIKQECKEEEGVGGEMLDDVAQAKLLKEAEEEEKALLSGVAQVRCRLFEGQMVQRSQPTTLKQVADEWRDLQKRSRTDRTVVVDGMAFILDSTAGKTVYLGFST